MRRSRVTQLVIVLTSLVWLVQVEPIKAQGRQAAPVRYELRFGRPNTHLLEITVRATGLRGSAAEFAMPAWAPGAYTIGSYAKMVQGFRATGSGGQALSWAKTDKQTWRVELGRATEVTIAYQLYGNTLANNWVQYNDKHAHIAGPAAWMYLVGGKERPVELSIAVPEGWKVATGMKRNAEGIYQAADYDWFADSPIEVSNFTESTFAVAGTTYHVVVHDIIGKKDTGRVVADIQKIVEATVPLYASVVSKARPAPFDDYWFLFHIWPNTGGGLEHLESTQINFGSDWDSTRPAGRYGSDYNLKLFVISHEFYHAWNVKRLRPRPLGPFDYSREVHTPSLWISEGLTSYYGELLLVHAGVVEPDDYLESIGQLITDLESQPGRRERSMEETSWDTWFSNAPPGDTNLGNTNHSYYDTGQIVGHFLDFAIRKATDNRKSLDDWMRLLYARHALPKAGFTPDDAVRAAREVAGTDLSDFFRRHISGKEPLPYEEYFAYAGIRVERKMDSEHAWLGVSFTRDAVGMPRITNVVPGGPADAAGLDRGDSVVSMDGNAVSQAEFSRAISAKKPGETIKLKVNRLGGPVELTVTLQANPNPTYVLTKIDNPAEQQKRIFESWIRGAGKSQTAAP